MLELMLDSELVLSLDYCASALRFQISNWLKRFYVTVDVSGGYTASILEAMRHSILMSKCLQMQDPDYKPLTYKDVFYLGTLGGAEGNLKPVQQFFSQILILNLIIPMKLNIL